MNTTTTTEPTLPTNSLISFTPEIINNWVEQSKQTQAYNMPPPRPPAFIMDTTLRSRSYKNMSNVPLYLPPNSCLVTNLCEDPKAMILLIRNFVSTIENVRILEYQPNGHSITIEYGTMPKDLTIQQYTMLSAAVTAYKKNPANFDADDSARIEAYKFIIDDSDLLLKWSKININLYYDPKENKIVVMVKRTNGDSKTQICIKNAIASDLMNHGYTVHQLFTKGFLQF